MKAAPQSRLGDIICGSTISAVTATTSVWHRSGLCFSLSQSFLLLRRLLSSSFIEHTHLLRSPTSPLVPRPHRLNLQLRACSNPRPHPLHLHRCIAQTLI